MKVIDRILQRWRVAKACPYLPAGSRLLDIGTADGAIFRHITHLRESIGIDPDLDPNPSGMGATFIKGLFPQDLPNNHPFDGITLLAVIEHLPLDSMRQLANDCYHHLNPGGYVIITVPSPAADIILHVLRTLRLIHGMSLEQHHGYEPGMTTEIFCASGLELVKSQRFQLGFNNLFVFRRPVRNS